MKNKYKIILIICVIIGICSILVGSIAYYRIVVEGDIKASTSNAVFVLNDETSNVWNNKEINLGKVNPGDSGSFTVTMDASGSTVDMYATLELDRGTLPTNLKFYTTSDHKSEIHKYYSFLETTNQTETLTIYWYWNPYISDIEDSKFINIDSIEANIRVSAIQISEYAMMKNGYDSTTGGTEFWNNTYKPYIRTITFGNDLSNLPSSCTEENLCWDISYSTSQNKKVYGYLIDSGLTVSETDSSTSTTTEKALYNLYIVSEAPIFAPNKCNFMFDSFTNLTAINFNDNFNTSKVTDMNGLFYFCYNLEELDLSSFNTNNVTRMLQMFRMPHHSEVATPAKLKKLNIDNFNASKVTDMRYMFYYCRSLTELDLSSFNTSNVTTMSGMFFALTNCTSLNISSFNTSKVTDMMYMFSYCESLIKLELNSFNTSKVTNMSYMFEGCSSLTRLDLSSFNTSNVINMASMFNRLYSIKSINLSNFDTSKVTNMGSLFQGSAALETLDLSSFDTSNVTNMRAMFGGIDASGDMHLKEIKVSDKFVTDNVTDMLEMFRLCKYLNFTFNVTGNKVTDYSLIFLNTATDPNAKITVNYIADASDLVDKMIATKSSNSNVVKGKQI